MAVGLGIGMGISLVGGTVDPALIIFGSALVLDLDSRYLTQAAGSVSAMADQSGKGNGCSQIGTAQPGYSALGGVNGLPKLTLNGTQSLVGTANPVASGASRTVYAVATPTAAAIAGLFCNRTVAPVAAFEATQASAGGYVYSDGVSVSETVASNPSSGVHLYVWKYTLGSIVTYIVDGAGQTVSGSVTTNDSGTAGYIAFSTAGGQGWVGDGYRILQVAGITTSQQDAAWRTVCQALYGTP